MKSVFYVAENLKNAINFIKVNTDWKQVTNVSFRNGDENIIVISDFMRIRGRKVDGVYIDHSFTKIKDTIYMDFTKRFRVLGIKPIIIE
ncbi:hypothetical protein [Echinimonas agarilytica]|uniref:Uncharacterized protein n=1 Tax=Echinimonas agarilytica TaxID=1215918 RepID=A0AA41W802_9GAMM|nr:hypothetical protein [Echinimonas agarilytica]MCM2680009.1 hypothetical protein [Echinimonas agarilytica]